MKKLHACRLVLAGATAGAGMLCVQSAFASNPLEYPDNGSASFSRGGAWLATASDPIATHYNPAGLATQKSGFSIEQQLNFNTVCLDRHGPGGAPESARPGLEYIPACNSRGSFPSTIPSISVAWRVTQKLGIGLAVVPPATYGTPDEAYPAVAPGANKTYQACVDGIRASGGTDFSACGQPIQNIPAPYRYMQLNQLSTIIFPTLGVGYEIAPRFRIGAAFISGIAVINSSVTGTINGAPGQGEDATNDTMSTLRTRDLFVPGAILSALWSISSHVDVAIWGRWLDSVKSSKGDLDAVVKPYKDSFDPTDPNPTFSTLKPMCAPGVDALQCPNGQYVNRAGDAFRGFKLPLPPEVRVGIRFHQPRTQADVVKAANFGTGGFASRDPLHDDVYDIELNGSYSLNELANTIEVRFDENPTDGTGTKNLNPTGKLPPNADRWNGYKNSVGVRLGGQYNVIQDKLGIRAGTWLETQSQDPKWLSVTAYGAMRGGVGGGIVFRQDFIDISIGYQYHWSAGLDNGGQGAMRTIAGSGTNADLTTFSTQRETATTAADRTQFRSSFFVNNGSVTHHAHAFTLGGTLRF